MTKYTILLERIGEWKNYSVANANKYFKGKGELTISEDILDSVVNDGGFELPFSNFGGLKLKVVNGESIIKIK